MDPRLTSATNQPTAQPLDQGNIAAFPLDGAAPEPPAGLLPMVQTGDRSTIAEAAQQLTALEQTTAQADQTGVLDGTPAPRVRDFRFLQAAQSARERELENQQSRLQRRLESTDERLQTADSVTTRINARLRRARLEADLDMISSQIRRFRIERIFASSTTPSPAIEAPQATAQTNASADMAVAGTQSAPNRTPMLNLIA